MALSQNKLAEHLKTPEQDRNFIWDEFFFKIFSTEQVSLLSKDPQQGPDGWPYLICETIKSSENNDLAEIQTTQQIFHWLFNRGIGLVVNPRREPYPDYVFSYGMIWSFKETGFFIRPDLANKSGEAIFENKKIKTGPPSEQFLPLYVRKILKDFFRDQSVLNPKVLMISQDEKNYDLCFSLESIGNPPTQEHAGVAEAISWFLPPHYSVVLISEQNLPSFIPL